MLNTIIYVIITLMLFFVTPAFGNDARIKDLVNFRGVRSNQLIGFGLVVGLKGTGDSKKSLTTTRASANMLTRLGMRTTAEEAPAGSVAAVVVTTDLQAFSRNGDRIDVRVSTVGDAQSLAGGTLVLTPLRAGDNQVYVVAQGQVVVGQANGSGPQVLTVANVPGGGVVEREFVPPLAPHGVLTVSLKQPDFTTNARIADKINSHFKGFYAKSNDPSAIDVTIPELFLESGRLIEFLSELENLRVTADQKAIVVINERTGTVVMGSQVVINDVTVAHGELSIQISKTKEKRVVDIDGTTVGKLVESLNSMGVKPADLIGILQAIHTAGALNAELKVM
jgi:flagellar P-ring protein precursor FlgI